MPVAAYKALLVRSAVLRLASHDLSRSVGGKAKASFSARNAVSFSELGAALDRTAMGDKEARVFSAGRQKRRFRHLMQALDALCSAANLRVTLVGLGQTRR